MKNNNTMKSKILYLCLFVAFLSMQISAQIASGYEVADWSGYRTCAVTYTFDDNSAKQFTVVQPIFDKYGYKMTFFVITKKITSWTNYVNAANNGHEIASHTVNHIRMDTMDIVRQDAELKNSKELIISKTDSKCLTMSYPNCALADRATTQKYYIAARSCAGTIVPKTPTDFYRISSISTGNASTSYMQTVKQFNDKVNSAKSSKGWCVFLTHSIDDEAGYSPTKSDTIAKHLEYIWQNDDIFWVASFGHIVKYIRERNALSISEIMINQNSYKFSVTDNLDNSIFNVPVTIKRMLPSTWTNAKIYQNDELLPSKIVTFENNKYVIFDIIPDNGDAILNNSAETKVIPIVDSKTFTVAPNPFTKDIQIISSDIFHYSIYTLDGRLSEAGEGNGRKNIGLSLPSGIYLLKIVSENSMSEKKIIKTVGNLFD